MSLRFLLLTCLLLGGVAHADLYRWVDPETGSVKYSSYPPPWFGDAAKQRRGPQVEHIPAGRPSPARNEEPDQAQRPAAPAQSGNVPAELEARRKAMLEQIPVLAAQAGPNRVQALGIHLESFNALSEQIDKLDPQGAAARRSEVQALIEKSVKGDPR